MVLLLLHIVLLYNLYNPHARVWMGGQVLVTNTCLNRFGVANSMCKHEATGCAPLTSCTSNVLSRTWYVCTTVVKVWTTCTVVQSSRVLRSVCVPKLLTNTWKLYLQSPYYTWQLLFKPLYIPNLSWRTQDTLLSNKWYRINWRFSLHTNR